MGRLRGRPPLRHQRARRGLSALAAIAAALLIPTLVLAHPLGNFTINHYAGIRVEVDRVLLDVVIDQAEIPTFQARSELDVDGDGEVDATEAATGRSVECANVAAQLTLTADGAALAPTLQAAGLSFPPGAGGLSTMRVVCEFVAPLPAPIGGASATRIAFSDGSFAQRIGWREITAVGSGVTLAAVEGELRTASISERLAAYPADMIATPLDDRSLVIDATAGGPELPPVTVDDATAVEGSGAAGSPAPSPATSPEAGASSSAASAVPTAATATPSPSATPLIAGAVPGGVGGGDLPSIFRTADLTPFVLLASVVTAIALGAGHALTPGHGKTLMAAYLVGTRGTPAHALGLGLSVSLSHTAGILVLAAVVVGAADILPPDLVVRAAPVVAAISIVVIGGWMLLGEWRRRRAVQAATASSGMAAHTHGRAGEHDHEHDHDHDHEHAHAAAEMHEHDDHGHDHDDESVPGEPAAHTHGGVTHSHLPPTGSAITWRSLFVLGLAGGLIPSTSALLILLGSIATGRPAFGFVLVVAFGLGMAAVMAGIGLAMVFARTRLDRMPAGTGLGRLRDVVPLVAAVLVFGFGLYLTAQAIGGTPTL